MTHPVAPTCPNCGSTCIAVTGLPPSTPPWLCNTCHRGWWNAELTPAARQAWSHVARAFNFHAYAGIMKACQAEYRAALRVARPKGRIVK